MNHNRLGLKYELMELERDYSLPSNLRLVGLTGLRDRLFRRIHHG